MGIWSALSPAVILTAKNSRNSICGFIPTASVDMQDSTPLFVGDGLMGPTAAHHDDPVSGQLGQIGGRLSVRGII